MAGDVPGSIVLDQNYPNPFNPTTTIRFALPKATNVLLRISNSLGQVVGTPLNATVDAGYHNIEWNAANLPSGIYYCRLHAAGYVLTKRMTLLK